VNGYPLFTSLSVIVEQSIVVAADELFALVLGGGFRVSPRVADEGESVRTF
jgi:hypothetical protein